MSKSISAKIMSSLLQFWPKLTTADNKVFYNILRV